MGQRHQIYLALPTCDLCDGKGVRPDGLANSEGKCNGCGGKGNRNARVVGVHIQNLYGRRAARQCARALEFMRADCADPLVSKLGKGYQNPQEILNTIYACIPEEGYFAETHTLEHGETEDPRRGDNNDGITILDARRIREGVIKYAFMGIEAEGGREPIPNYVPVDADTYMSSYYPVAHKDRDPETDADIHVLVARVASTKAELLTPSEVAAIFPVLKSKVRKRARKIARKPSSDALL